MRKVDPCTLPRLTCLRCEAGTAATSAVQKSRRAVGERQERASESAPFVRLFRLLRQEAAASAPRAIVERWRRTLFGSRIYSISDCTATCFAGLYSLPLHHHRCGVVALHMLNPTTTRTMPALAASKQTMGIRDIRIPGCQ